VKTIRDEYKYPEAFAHEIEFMVLLEETATIRGSEKSSFPLSEAEAVAGIKIIDIAIKTAALALIAAVFSQTGGRSIDNKKPATVACDGSLI
jgi:hypothetical protein